MGHRVTVAAQLCGVIIVSIAAVQVVGVLITITLTALGF